VRTCPSGDPIVFAATDPVDWRRVMWYEPRATAVNVVGNKTPQFVGRFTDFTAIPPFGIRILDPCATIWITSEAAPPGGMGAATVTSVPGLGFLIEAREVLVTPAKIEFR
jgi:hypothetical protein